MTRPIILGNGNMLACFDKNARIRDFYYPYVGQENHVTSNHHRTGIFVDGKFSWIEVGAWDLSINYKKDTLVSEVIAFSKDLEVELKINEAIHPEKNILVRRVFLTNKSSKKREIKIFFSQRFHISESDIGDTVYYDPSLDSIIHYKGQRYFLMGGTNHNKKSFDDYATGSAGTDGRDGTWKDAEDGFLSKNPIEHGSVDSTISFTNLLEINETKEINFWIIVGKKHREINELRKFVNEKGCEKIIQETENHWRAWLGKGDINFQNLSEKVQNLFRRSLLVIRAQTDNNGAIIAANDTHTFHFKKDTYSYMWPRDGALVARSLDRVGHHAVVHRFFKFCSELITDDGYFLHKYRPDGSFGSSWHSWLRGKNLQLPIQEDETALILDALWKHYKEHDTKEEIEEMYKTLILPAGNFLRDFRDPDTNLPKPSYDLWEEKLGVHTFTCSTVYAGLIAAKNFAEVFGKKSDAKKYEKAAEEVKEAILKYLYDPKEKIFLKGVFIDKDCVDKCELIKDYTLDMSTGYGLFEFNVLPIDDERLTRTMQRLIENLWNNHGSGGMTRYKGDRYYQTSEHAPENPWYIATMWLAEYNILKAKNQSDLKQAEELINWAADKALPSGVMSEQINPFTGEHLSVAPLTWSHASFITAVVKYLEKFEELSGKR